MYYNLQAEGYSGDFFGSKKTQTSSNILHVYKIFTFSLTTKEISVKED